MRLSQKCLYSVRAVFELARQQGNHPVRVADIAEKQGIPVRFLEVLMNELKQGGFVSSVRGKSGGYVLSRPASQLTIGEVIKFVEGPVLPIECVRNEQDECKFSGRCVFMPVWEKMRQAVDSVIEDVSFQRLVEDEKKLQSNHEFAYSI